MNQNETVLIATNKMKFYFVYCIPNRVITVVVYVFMKRYK